MCCLLELVSVLSVRAGEKGVCICVHARVCVSNGGGGLWVRGVWVRELITGLGTVVQHKGI